MKKSSALFISAILVVLGAVANGPALAHGRVHFGFFVGGPIFWPGYYAPYYPPVYVAPPPPVYIERQAAPAPQPPEWFYCADSKTYYPYVKECPGGWQRVPAQPSPR